MTATDKDNASEPKAAEDNAKVAPPAKDAGAQYRVAIDRYREAAKWAVGAFGGIGAVLVAALPLAQFGAGFESSPAVVIAGTGLALAGVALAIASTLAVLAPRTVFSFELEAADKNRLVAFFSGGASMQRLLFKHGDVLLPAGIGDMAGLSRAIERIDKIASRNSGKPHQAVGVANLRAQRAEYVAHLEELLWVARLEKMRAAFHWSSASIVAGGLAVGIGVGLLFTGLNDVGAQAKAKAETGKVIAETDKISAEAAKVRAETPSGPKEAEDVDLVVPSPTANVTLTELGRTLFDGCKIAPEEQLPAVVLNGDGATGDWTVLVLPTPTCAGGRVELTPELGTLG